MSVDLVNELIHQVIKDGVANSAETRKAFAGIGNFGIKAGLKNGLGLEERHVDKHSSTHV